MTITQTEEQAERSARARQAVKNFRAMLPGLNAYARALSGRRDLQVVLAESIPMTDGNKIFMKPPISLGDVGKHERHLCDKRDPESLQQLCSACQANESVLIDLLHEIGHNIFGTFEPSSPEARKAALQRAIESQGSAFAKRLSKEFERLPNHVSYLKLSGLVSPFLPVLVNCLEDVRVDGAMMRARKGTKAMFAAKMQRYFVEGVERDDGSIGKWDAMPLNSQAIIGVYCVATDADFTGWFHPVVEEALRDPELAVLCGRVDSMRSAAATYEVAFPILARLRELGFCLPPEEQPPLPSQGDDQDEDAPEGQDPSGEDDNSGSGTDSSDSSSDEGDNDPDGEGNESEASDGSDGDSPESGDSDDEPSGAEDGDDGSAQGEADDGDDSQGSGSSDQSSEGADSDDCESPVREGDSSDTGGVSQSEADGESTEGPSEGSGEDESPGSGGEADELSEDDDVPGSRGDDSGADDDSGPDADPGHEDLGQEPGELTDGDEGDSDRSGEGEDDGDDLSGSGSDTETEGEGDEPEPIDTGADEGRGGVESPPPPWGDADDALRDVKSVTGHEDVHVEDSPEDQRAIETAIMQGLYFETDSLVVDGVQEFRWGDGNKKADAWRYQQDGWNEYELRRIGVHCDTTVPESVLSPVLVVMRRVFSDNARAAFQRDMKSGRIRQNVLGKRAWAKDERLFQKKRLPGKRSYAVLIGVDISGSTHGVNIALAKRAAMAQAEMCHRLGIDFAVYAHTANRRSGMLGAGYMLDIYVIKSFDDMWNDKAREAFANIGADAENLDGHTLERYRKIIERHPATDKIILYYTDGKMPAANHDEELEILQREIRTCQQKRITLLGVGIRTDSPRRHGLDTVEVNTDSDLSKVVTHLESALLRSR